MRKAIACFAVIISIFLCRNAYAFNFTIDGEASFNFLKSVDVIDTVGHTFSPNTSATGTGGGLFIGPMWGVYKGDYLGIGILGFVVDGVKTDNSAGGAAGDAAGFEIIPVTFLNNAIQIGMGWNNLAQSHVYVGFSLGNLFSGKSKPGTNSAQQSNIQ